MPSSTKACSTPMSSCYQSHSRWNPWVARYAKYWTDSRFVTTLLGLVYFIFDLVQSGERLLYQVVDGCDCSIIARLIKINIM